MPFFQSRVILYTAVEKPEILVTYHSLPLDSPLNLYTATLLLYIMIVFFWFWESSLSKVVLCIIVQVSGLHFFCNHTVVLPCLFFSCAEKRLFRKVTTLPFPYHYVLLTYFAHSQLRYILRICINIIFKSLSLNQ